MVVVSVNLPSVPITVVHYLITQITRSVHFSVGKSTRCTISQIYFILEQHYMFRTVSPSIIRSLRLYIQHHTIHSLRLLMMNGETARNM